METTNEKKFSLTAYAASYRDNCGDDNSSNIEFYPEMTLKELEEKITNTLRYQDADQEWEFLICYKGTPISARGESFDQHKPYAEDFGSNPNLQGMQEIAVELEAMFKRANLLTENEKKAKREAEQKAEAERAQQYRAQQEAARYYDAQKTIREYEAKRGTAVKP